MNASTMEGVNREARADTMPFSEEKLANLIRIMPVFTIILTKEWIEKYEWLIALDDEAMRNEGSTPISNILELRNLAGENHCL